jgi:parallel beta-helix repeat protein
MKTNVIPVNGMVITEDTTFAPGVYHLPEGITIGADGVTIRGEGTLIVSAAKTGSAIRATGHQRIGVHDLSISGFYYGIRFDQCQDVAIENVTIRETMEIEGIDTFLYLWLPIEKAYSGAILLHEVTGGVVRGCDLQHQLNGILLYGCSQLQIEKNNASFNSGWGVYLSASNRCTVQDNHLDFCNRLYRRPEDGSIRAEADSAGIVLVKSSCNNQFLRNSCIGGGDGIFVAGYEHPGKIDSCNDNLFEENDCRLSPNNAIESTFSRGNIFRRNNCSRSNYGMWMGFSWENTIEDNLIEFSRFVGIAIEHGHDFTIRNNALRLNGEGIRLWTRGGVVDYWPGYEVSFDYRIEGNQFEQNGIGFAGYTGDERTDQDCHNFHLSGNHFDDNRVGAFFGRVRDCTLHDNTFRANIVAAVQLAGKAGVSVGSNHYADNRADVIETERR